MHEVQLLDLQVARLLQLAPLREPLDKTSRYLITAEISGCQSPLQRAMIFLETASAQSNSLSPIWALATIRVAFTHHMQDCTVP